MAEVQQEAAATVDGVLPTPIAASIVQHQQQQHRLQPTLDGAECLSEKKTEA